MLPASIITLPTNIYLHFPPTITNRWLHVHRWKRLVTYKRHMKGNRGFHDQITNRSYQPTAAGSLRLKVLLLIITVAVKCYSYTVSVATEVMATGRHVPPDATGCQQVPPVLHVHN